jgi:hypothetical protein
MFSSCEYHGNKRWMCRARITLPPRPDGDFRVVVAANVYSYPEIGYSAIRELTILTPAHGSQTYDIMPDSLPLDNERAMAIINSQRALMCLPLTPNPEDVGKAGWYCIREKDLAQYLREYLMMSYIDPSKGRWKVAYTGEIVGEFLKRELGVNIERDGYDIERDTYCQIDWSAYVANICSLHHNSNPARLADVPLRMFGPNFPLCSTAWACAVYQWLQIPYYSYVDC